MDDRDGFSEVLYHDDLSALPLGRDAGGGGFHVIARGLGKYLETEGVAAGEGDGLRVAGSECWREYRFRAVVTPLSFDEVLPQGGFCGIVAHYRHARDFIALVLTRGFQLKLLRRDADGFRLLAWTALEFCLGQSLTLTLTLHENKISGTAGPYSGAATIEAPLAAGPDARGGKVGFISAAQARFGPHTVECKPEEARRIENAAGAEKLRIEAKRARFPKMRLERTIALNGLASPGSLRIADIDQDGKLEILAVQCSANVARRISLTQVTCVTALDLEGKTLWQAGVPRDEAESALSGDAYADLPVRVHDLYGDGHPVVVCVFGYDIQIRDGKTGRVLMSSQTPGSVPVSAEFKNLFRGGIWGDEALNMEVRHIAFCDTQGNGGKKELLVSDGRYTVAVLDPLAEPLLHPLWRQRGNVSGSLWAGDVDGDGKDEILAGGALIDDDGTSIATLTVAPHTHGLVEEPLGDGRGQRRIYLGSDEAGLIATSLKLISDKGGEHGFAGRLTSLRPSRLIAGRFRADLPGTQIAALEQVRRDCVKIALLDSELNFVWEREYAMTCAQAAHAFAAVQWAVGAPPLMLSALTPDGGLLDGEGDIVVPGPEKKYSQCAVIPGYRADGGDGIAAWNEDSVSIYVPEI